MNDYKMTPGELRATWGLGTVFSLRMLGMFMVLPVLTTYGMALQVPASINRHCDRHLRTGAGYLSNSLWIAFRPHWP